MRYKLGVDLGGTHIGAGLVDANGNLLKKLYVPTPENRDFDETVKAIIKSGRAASGGIRRQYILLRQHRNRFSGSGRGRDGQNCFFH